MPSKRVLTAFACMLIVTLGAFLRLAGTNWDEEANLHPDERHMVFVIKDALRGLDALKPGEMSMGELWFADQSPLNPRKDRRFYVYGELPHLAVTVATRLFGDDGWPQVMRFGRTVGAVLDSYTILAVFFLGTLLCRSALASLGAAALYAVTPLAIQNANFFTVDIWLTAMTAWSLVAGGLLLHARSPRAATGWALVGGIFAGAALACKLPGLAAAGALILAIAIHYWRRRPDGQSLLGAIAQAMVALLATFIAFRLLSPFHFAGPGLFGIAPSPAALANYAEASRGFLDPGFPPNWQWLTGYGPSDAVADLALWGLGPAISLAVLAGGAALIFKRHPLYDRLSFLLPVALILAYFVYWLLGVPALRYVLATLPALCALTVAGFTHAAGGRFGRVAIALLLAVAGIWSLGIYSLHTTTHSRVAASRWLWNETPKGTIIVNETSWDEGLPVVTMLPGRPTPVWPGQEDHFKYLKLDIEAPDNAEKARNIAQRLGAADFLAISSERFRKPILALSKRFPMTGAYYRLLAEGKLCFEQVKAQPSAYPVLGFKLDDRGAQEPWSVYDHPTVEIYRRLGCYDAGETERLLLQALAKGS